MLFSGTHRARARPALLAAIAALGACLGAAAGQDAAPEPEPPAPSPERDRERDERAAERERQAAERRRQEMRRLPTGRIRSIVRDLGSLDAGERLAALADLEALGSRATSHLRASLRSRNGYEVRYAIVALGRIGDAAAAPDLERLVADAATTPADRFYAVGALARIASPTSLDLLLAHAADEREAVRRAAVLGVRRAGGDAALPRLLRMLEGRDEAARDAARAVLRDIRRDAVARLGREAERESGGAGGGSPQTEADGDEELARFCRESRDDLRVRPSEPDLSEVWLPGITVVTDLPEERARAVAGALPPFREAALAWLSLDDVPPWRTHLRLFSSRRAFEDYGCVHDSNFPWFTEFYYSFLLREIVAHDIPDGAVLARRLRHESVHDLVEHAAGRAPPWLNEGLAELLEVAAAGEDGALALAGENREWTSRVRELAASGPLPRLRELLAMAGEDFYGANQSLHYAAAWSFVRYLAVVRGEEGRRLLGSVLRALGRREGGAAAATAALEAEGLDALERGWIDSLAEIP